MEPKTKRQDKDMRMPISSSTVLGCINRERSCSSKLSSSPTLAQGNVPPPQTLDSQPNHPPRRPIGGDPDPVKGPPPPPPLAATTTAVISTTAGVPTIRYRECLKNHAASLGSHVVDGCGEFMPSGEEGTPQALKCAACECHRNFHRKEIEGATQAYNNTASCCYYTHKNDTASRDQYRNNTVLPSLTYPYHQHHYHRIDHGHHKLAQLPPSFHHRHTPNSGAAELGGGPAAESSSEDLNLKMFRGGGEIIMVQAPNVLKKRFRTKFTQEQKDRMMEFAEKIGWKIQKHDEKELQEFCSQVGVRRQVFRVWMHNSKQTMKKKKQLIS